MAVARDACFRQIVRAYFVVGVRVVVAEVWEFVARTRYGEVERVTEYPQIELIGGRPNGL